MLKQGAIFACFSCTGKTHFVLNNFLKQDCIDFDFYDFKFRGQLGENWLDLYMKRMKQLQSKFDLVYVNALPEVLERAEQRTIVIYPKRALKQEWLERAWKRSAESSFPKLLEEKWDEWIDACDAWEGFTMQLNSGQYISDVL